MFVQKGGIGANFLSKSIFRVEKMMYVDVDVDTNMDVDVIGIIMDLINIIVIFVENYVQNVGPKTHENYAKTGFTC